MIQVACAEGVRSVTVASVIGRAGLSRRTFYSLFDDCGDCLCAAIEQIVARAAERAIPAYQAERRWVARVRAGLAAMLEFFDEEPGLAQLCFVQAAATGSQALTRRVELIALLAQSLDDEYRAEHPSRELPPQIAYGAVGGVLEIIHAYLLSLRGEQHLITLRNELMAVIALPFLGPAAAHREIARRVQVDLPKDPRGRGVPSAPVRPGTRITYRTHRVLGVITARPGLSNREISDRAGITDQGQISKLLSRLAQLGHIENVGAGYPLGTANAWRLTDRGTELMLVIGRRTSRT
jgi:AcrR family transcriptional regulator